MTPWLLDHNLENEVLWLCFSKPQQLLCRWWFGDNYVGDETLIMIMIKTMMICTWEYDKCRKPPQHMQAPWKVNVLLVYNLYNNLSLIIQHAQAPCKVVSVQHVISLFSRFYFHSNMKHSNMCNYSSSTFEIQNPTTRILQDQSFFFSSFSFFSVALRGPPSISGTYHKKAGVKTAGKKIWNKKPKSKTLKKTNKKKSKKNLKKISRKKIKEK